MKEGDYYGLLYTGNIPFHYNQFIGVLEKFCIMNWDFPTAKWDYFFRLSQLCLRNMGEVPFWRIFLREQSLELHTFVIRID